MRIVMLVVALSGIMSISACSFLNPSGSAAARWAAIDEARAAKLAGGADADKICKTVPVTGSTMPKKICSTQAEWETVERQQREASDKFNSDLRNNTGNVGSSGS